MSEARLSRAKLELAICLGPVLLAVACHSTVLNLLGGALTFSSPDQPAAVQQPDAGVVRIDFGQVTIDSTKTLTVDLSSLVGQVTLGSITALQPDPEFTLPFVPGAVVGTAPSATVMTFTPSSVGTKTATYELLAGSS